MTQPHSPTAGPAVQECVPSSRWQTEYRISRAFGDAWLKASEQPVLRVPSLITPGEWNFLLNPLQRDFSLKRVIAGPSTYTFDHGLLEQS